MRLLALFLGHRIDPEKARDIRRLRKENRALRRHFDRATLRSIRREVRRRMKQKIQAETNGSIE